MPEMIVFDFTQREVLLVGPNGETHRLEEQKPVEMVGTASPPLQPV